MKKEGQQHDYGKSSRPFGDWVFKRHRRIHRAFRILPQLEEDLANICQEIFSSDVPNSDARIEHEYLLSTLAIIRMEIRTAFRALSELRQGIDRSGISDDAFAERVEQLYADRQDGNKVLAQLRNAGGMRKFMKRMSLFLLNRYESYTKCLRLVKEFDRTSSEGLIDLITDLWDELPCSPGSPDVQYSFLCAGGPLAWAVTAALVAAVVVLEDDQGGDSDPPDDDDDSDSEGDDPDEGVCYPEPGLDPVEGTCSPA